MGSVLYHHHQRVQVFGNYATGCVDIQYNDGTEGILSLAQQRDAIRIDVNAPPVVLTGNRRNDPKKRRSAIAEWAVSYVAVSPERTPMKNNPLT